ncbi:hypothetical protein [Streptomyces sp. NPDC008317]|uniref:hypothetical protein n=1 Tax=Streptomyces sp. NPDC008317 TaxID=3364827 RepID=UPI0036E443CF
MKAKVMAGAGAMAGAGGVLVGGLPLAAAVLGVLVVAVLALLVWTVADASRTQRLAELIRAYRAPSAQLPSWSGEASDSLSNSPDQSQTADRHSIGSHLEEAH